MGACGSKSAKKNFAGEGHSLQPAAGTATAAKTGVTSPTSPIQSPGYRLGGGDPEKVVSSPPGTEQPPLNTTDQSEREKRLQAIKQREEKDKYANKVVKPRAFSQSQ